MEHGVFSTSGGMGPTANMVYKRVSSMIAQKHDKTYSTARPSIASDVFTLALSNYVPKKSKIQHSPPYNIPTMDLACHEGRVPLHRLNPHTFKQVLFYLGVVYF